MALKARGKWATVQHYSGQDAFDLANADQDPEEWYEKPEASMEEKRKKFKEAEATTKWYQTAIRRVGTSRGRGASNSSVSSSSFKSKVCILFIFIIWLLEGYL